MYKTDLDTSPESRFNSKLAEISSRYFTYFYNK